MEKKILLIDMDNTIVDYSTPISDAIRKEGNVNSNPSNWFTFTNQKPLRKIQKRTQSAPHFFLNLKPIDGALECLKELDSLGYIIFIVSSPSVNSDTCHSDKAKWLTENMGEHWARKLILTKDKTVVIGDFLIDDRMDITGVIEKPTWKHIMFTQPDNINHKSDLRLNEWSMSSVLNILQSN